MLAGKRILTRHHGEFFISGCGLVLILTTSRICNDYLLKKVVRFGTGMFVLSGLVGLNSVTLQC